MAQHKRAKTSRQNADLQEKCNTLSRRIQQWREVQLAYTPTVATLVIRAGSTAGSGEEGSLAENVPLFLPSGISDAARQPIIHATKKELRLRMAQADEALEDVRRGRRMITGLVQFKKLNISGAGNKPNTRMRTLYNRLQLQIQRAADRYRAARDALLALDPNGTWQDRFRKLNPADIRGPGRQEDDKIIQTNGQYEMSWIWLISRSSNGDSDGEAAFDETMRSEWAKMRARGDRWDEEYMLVQEEMRRTVVYLEWKANWWKGQASRRVVENATLMQGLSAYAYRQESLLTSLAASCAMKWVGALRSHGETAEWTNKYVSAKQSSASSSLGDNGAGVSGGDSNACDADGDNECLDDGEGFENEVDEDDEDDDSRFERYDLYD